MQTINLFKLLDLLRKKYLRNVSFFCWKIRIMGSFERMHRGLDVIFYNSLTFFLTRDMMPILVRTCCLDNPSLGTPSAKASALSAPGSHRCLMKSDTYALNTFSDLFLRSLTSLQIRWFNSDFESR